jgi:hypothetical protein
MEVLELNIVGGLKFAAKDQMQKLWLGFGFGFGHECIYSEPVRDSNSSFCRTSLMAYRFAA